MSNSEMLRKHHKDLVELVVELESGLALPKDDTRIQSIRSCLSRLAGLLTIHLSMEDKVMYPKLHAHPDAKVVEMSKRFSSEMEGIKGVFEGYKKKWMGPNAIESGWAEFLSDTKGLIAALRARISKEDNELYPLVDSLDI